MSATPRRGVPSRGLPAIAGTTVVLLALPLFIAAGWDLAAWGIAAFLWGVYQLIGIWLDRVSATDDNLAAVGLVAFGRITRAVVLVGTLIVIAVKDSELGLPAAIVYALAFTVEFGLLLAFYAGGGTQGR